MPPFTIVRDGIGHLGMHAVATAALSPGEPVLLEPPLVSTDSAVSEGLPSSEVEWMLVHALLTSGHTAEWAAQYLPGGCGEAAAASPPAPPPTDDDAAAIEWLCEAHGLPPETVNGVYRVVTRHAFGLETPLLAVEYGAAFYGTACRLNHSCSPNCISVRFGGNMAVFCGSRPIAAGEELVHSYLPPRLLALPRQARAPHLNFECRCPRCAAEEAGSTAAAAMASLGLPAGHARTAAGTEMAKLMALAATGDADAVLRQGAAVLGAEPALLSSRPLAALEVCLPMLTAYWSAMAQRGGGYTAPVGGSAVVQAAELAAAAAAQVDAGVAAALGPHTPAAHLALLRHTCALQSELLRGRSGPEVAAAVREIDALLGGGADTGRAWLRDDAGWLPAAVVNLIAAQPGGPSRGSLLQDNGDSVESAGNGRTFPRAGFAPSDRVRVTGLVKTPAMNGVYGTVQLRSKWKQNRVAVLLDTDPPKLYSMKPENLDRA